MNRRGFLKAASAIVAAPWVITSAGVLPRPPQIIEANRNWNGPGGRGDLSKAWLLTDD